MSSIRINGAEQFAGPVGIGTTPVAGQSLTLKTGTGTATVTPVGVLHVNATQAGNAANINAQTLWTYTLPANTLDADGKGVRIRVFGHHAATANDKQVTLYFGATAPLAIWGNFNDVDWVIEVVVIRTGAATQLAIGHRMINGGLAVVVTAPTETLSGDVVIRVAAASYTTGAANDIVFRGALVEAF